MGAPFCLWQIPVGVMNMLALTEPDIQQHYVDYQILETITKWNP